MKKPILTAALMTLFCASTVLAGHDHLRRDYEVSRINLEQDYKARREANKYAYHRERDALYAERRRANKIDCRDTRAARVRAINRDLSALSREYHANNKAISNWYNASRRSLRETYEANRRIARNVRPTVVETVVERPVVVRHPSPTLHGHVAPHPADCTCNVCVPPPVEVCPSEANVRYRDDYYRDDYGRRGVRVEHRRVDYAPVHYNRKPNALDWASLILGLMN